MPNKLANRLVLLLQKHGLSLSLAESCTGGDIAGAITDVPGASQVFAGGVVVYTAAAKMSLLGLGQSELPPGCVGRELSLKMAARVRSMLATDLSLAITGALGPTSPSDNVAVGEVHIGLSGAGGSKTVEFIFSGDRQTIKVAAVRAAIDCLLQFIEGCCLA